MMPHRAAAKERTAATRQRSELFHPAADALRRDVGEARLCAEKLDRPFQGMPRVCNGDHAVGSLCAYVLSRIGLKGDRPRKPVYHALPAFGEPLRPGVDQLSREDFS